MNVAKRVKKGKGNDTFVYDPRKNKLLVLFYKSSIKLLLSLCITIVLRVYCEADLLKLKLPKAVLSPTVILICFI